MTPFTIIVKGNATIPKVAERALLNISVSTSGDNKLWVSDQVITATKHLESLLGEYCPANDSEEAKQSAALAHWSKTSLTATSHIPGDKDGNDRPRKYMASVAFDIRFRDFSKLGTFGSQLSRLPHIEVKNVNWMLLTATESSFRAQLREEAVRDALQKAEDYARVLGFTSVRPIELGEGHYSSGAANYKYRATQAARAANPSHR